MNPVPPHEPAGRSDGELLQRYLDSRDDAALTELVARYAALVRGVCRRMLGDTPDADDAFQATFLVLLRAGEGVRRPRSLAAWLYGVAHRIAKRQRRQRGKSVRLVPEAQAMVDSDPLSELATQHDLSLFDAELARLPEKYRAPIVLHHLQGKTQREVAAELQLTEGAVDGLLKRGRNELRIRLARRGVTFGVTLAALQAAQSALAATSPANLIETTVQGMLAHDPLLHPEPLPTPAAQLAQQEIATMAFYHVLKLTTWTLAGSLLLGAAGVGVSTARNLPALNVAGVIASEIDPSSHLTQLAWAVAADDAADEPASAEAVAEEEPASEPQAPADFREGKLSEHPIIKALEEQTEISFVETSLRDSMVYWGQLHHINIYVNTAEIEESGGSVDQMLNLELSGVKARTGLKLMLEPLGLDYVIDDEVMKITTRKAAENYRELRIYDLNDAWRGKEMAERIEALVKDTAGGLWKKPGTAGLGGTVQWTPTGLAVRHNQKVLIAVEKLLTQLNQKAIAAERREAQFDFQRAQALEADAARKAVKSPDPIAPLKKGEKISLIGEVDFDGDNKSDREQLHQILKEQGIEVELEVEENGTTRGTEMTEGTKYLVLGFLPEGGGGFGSPEFWRQWGKNREREKRLVQEAQTKGIRIVSLSEFLKSVGYAGPIQPTPVVHVLQEQPHAGEKISLVGEIDLDGDGKSDRQQLVELLEVLGMEIDNVVDDEGKRTGTGITEATKFLVLGDIPDPRAAKTRANADKARAVIDQLHELRNEASRKGVRIISVNDLLQSIGHAPVERKRPPDAQPPVHFRRRKPAEARIESALHEQTEISFVDTSLRDALEYIEDLHNFEILINEPEITADNGNVDQQVNLELSGVTLESALNRMLEPLELDYVLKDEILMITTRNKADEFQELRVYNLDLLRPLVDGVDYSHEDERVRLETMIKKAVAGEWLDAEGKGKGGTISLTDAGLVVRQNQRTHREIENFIEQVRQANGEPGTE